MTFASKGYEAMLALQRGPLAVMTRWQVRTGCGRTAKCREPGEIPGLSRNCDPRDNVVSQGAELR